MASKFDTRQGLIATAFASLIVAAGFQTTQPGTLELTIVDGPGGQPTPARVELADSDSKGHVADDALPTDGDCGRCSGFPGCPDLSPGENLKLTVPLARWINLAQEGWYSADDHLHIPRPARQLDPSLSKWMQAEDVRVANLLQLGQSTEFRSSPQYAFGRQSWYREGDYLLASAQENPRTDFLGSFALRC